MIPRSSATVLAGASGISSRLRAALLALPRRWRRLVQAGQSGQAMVESTVLLATLLAGLAVGAGVLMRNQPQLMNVLDIYMKGFYFTYSLPFP